MSKVSVLCAGSWGTALATVLASNGHEVTLWSAKPEEAKYLAQTREHTAKLPGVKLADSMIFTSDLYQAVTNQELLVLAVPSIHMRETARKMAAFVKEGQLIVDVSKGIEEKTLLPMVEIIKEEIAQAEVGVLSGPSHAEEVGKRMPTTCVAGADKKKTAEKIQEFFMNEYFRVYTSPDVLGIELGGSLKNVIALAAGMADGLCYGDNTKAALITRGIAEISRLGVAMGASLETINGLTGMGDLIVTCSSTHSRNRKAGMLMGQGYSMEEACREVKMVVEGVHSAKAAKALADRYQVNMPIVQGVYEVLFEGYSPKEAVSDLMLRDKKQETSTLRWEE